MRKKSPLIKYSYAWVTVILFLGSLAGHWTMGWFAYKNEQETHGQPPGFAEYATEMGRDTLENWQSEFLQLIWQVGGLSFLFYLGSPQSKEGDERTELKLDHILRVVDPGNAEKTLSQIDEKWGR